MLDGLYVVRQPEDLISELLGISISVGCQTSWIELSEISGLFLATVRSSPFSASGSNPSVSSFMKLILGSCARTSSPRTAWTSLVGEDAGTRLAFDPRPSKNCLAIRKGETIDSDKLVEFIFKHCA